jgi:hypothetical protein
MARNEEIVYFLLSGSTRLHQGELHVGCIMTAGWHFLSKFAPSAGKSSN